MVQKVKIEGLKELEAALSQLPTATGKNVLKRVLLARGRPIAEAAAASADRVSGALARSFGVSTVLSSRQKGLHKKMFADEKAAVEVFVGAGPLPQAHLEEFGSTHNAPSPMLRPAWDGGRDAALDGIADDLWKEIEAAAARLAKKAAKLK